MTIRTRWAWHVLVLMAAGCSAGGNGSSSSSGGGTSTPTGAAFMAAYYKAICVQQARCASTHGTDFVTQEVCEHNGPDYDHYYELVFGKSLTAYLMETTHIDDASANQACLDAMAASCETGSACDASFRPKGTRQAGQNCSGDLLAPLTCAEGLFCKASTGGGCATCAARQADGTACTSNGDCTSGYCNNTGMCGVRPEGLARGAPCGMPGTRCVGQLECAGTGGNRTCQEKGGANAMCDLDASVLANPTCKGGLSCVGNGSSTTGTCQPLKPDGSTCVRQPVNEPNCMGFCRFATADAATGMCAPIPETLPAIGEPCLYDGTSAFCADYLNTYPKFTLEVSGGDIIDKGCVCASNITTGTACPYSFACTSGYCAGANVTTATMGVCTDKVASGACTTANACRSGDCNNGQCAAEVMCN